MTKTFLKAEWRKLAMINYVVDPALLMDYLPNKTELDVWNGTCYVSLVGFMFQNTKVKGIKIPFHVDFEEVNLRFYVRYKDANEWKRGVVFIKEVVPKSLLTFVANTIYNENYETMPMQHTWLSSADQLHVEYRWKKNNWNSVKVIADVIPKAIAPNSEEEFITEHYWGYTKITAEKTSEYGVEHPKWDMYPTLDYEINVDFGDVYGAGFEFLNKEIPRSVFLAEGSGIEVKAGRII